MKYTLTPHESGFYRIVAAKTFTTITGETIHEGQQGGLIETTDNLSQEGRCWIGPDARVTENARVTDDALIGEQAAIRGHARIKDRAYIHGNALVRGRTIVEGEAHVYGQAIIAGFAHVAGTVFGQATVTGQAYTGRQTWVMERASVSGKARLTDKAVATGAAIVQAPMQGGYIAAGHHYKGTLIDAEIIDADHIRVMDGYITYRTIGGGTNEVRA